MIGIILAGGSGTRFWPKSRETLPKQLIKIAGSKTMIQYTVERLLPTINIEDIYVVTHQFHAFETCRQLKEFGFLPSNLIAEPIAKNTAPALALASVFLKENHFNDVLGIFPADHVISDSGKFKQVLKDSEEIAFKDYLVTLGVEPSRPETGYGYIKKGKSIDKRSKFFIVDQFIEKPDIETAKTFLAAKEHFWNCGIFFWKTSRILEELKNHMPKTLHKIESALPCLQTQKGPYPYLTLDEAGKNIYDSLEGQSIDYGIMEKSNQVAVVATNMPWNDVGSWVALSDLENNDADGNVLSDDVIALNCENSIIQSNDRLIAAIGTKDLIIVDTPDALLVCPKDEAQEVKKIVEKLKEKERPETKFPSTVHKPWGSYTVLENTPGQLVKRLEVLPGAKLSLQMHNHRKEQWLVVRGTAEIQLEDKFFFLEKNQSTFIPQGSKHRLGNPGKEPLTILEVQLGDKIDEDDIVRYQDDFGREDLNQKS
jgi:mannose-1-phosphate guanylyltransferase / mannose-6-phosphate isomerase